MCSIQKLLVSLALCVPQIDYCGLVSMFKAQAKDSNQQVMLCGDIHEFNDRPHAEIMAKEETQLTSFDESLHQRDTRQTNLDVSIEQPYNTVPARKRRRNCMNSLMENQNQHSDAGIEFHDAERRKASLFGLLMFNVTMPLRLFTEPLKKIMVNKREMNADSLRIKEIKKEYSELLKDVEKHKDSFSDNANLKSTYKEMKKSAHESYGAFKHLYRELNLSENDTVLTFAQYADQKAVENCAIPAEFYLPGTSARSAGSFMLSGMMNPLFELDLASKIRTSENDQALIAGLSHTESVEHILKQTEDYQTLFSIKPSIQQRFDSKQLLQKKDFKRLFNS